MSTLSKMSLRTMSLALLVFGLGIGMGGAQTLPIDKGFSTTTDTPPSHDATVGTLAGSAGTEAGAATYNIPIVVPPGRAGMQPSLALVYNSRGGDGVMGMGWSISGLSSIHRCPQTLEQDGQALGVNYSSSDRLCLDGQRLVKVGTGTYGAAGTTYSTEIDSHARITQVGGDLTSSAACFRVEQKDGRILHYGSVTNGSPSPTGCAASTANARVNPTGTGVATLSWLVEKIEDRAGNNQLYRYGTDCAAGTVADGEALPCSVTYTGFGSTAGNRSVNFNYQSRSAISTALTDLVSSSYLAGRLTMQTKALLSVTTNDGTGVVRTITPAYVASAYSGRLQVDSIQECAGATCHPLTNFTSTSDGSAAAAQNFHLAQMSDLNIPAAAGAPPLTPEAAERAARDIASYRPAPVTTDATGGVTQLVQVAGDFDGDGTRETAVAVLQGTVQHEYVVQLLPDHAQHSAVEVTGILCFYWDCYADFAGDGRSEAMVVPHSATDHSTIQLAVWTLPRGTIAQTSPFHLIETNIPSPIIAPGVPAGNVPRAVDLNGDGKLDIAVEKDDATCGADDHYGHQRAVYGYYSNAHINPATGQIVEDGHVFDDGHKLFCLTRTVAGAPAYVITKREYVDHIADFNGDGAPDFFVADAFAIGTPTLTRVKFLQPGGTSTTEQSCTGIGLVSSGTAITDECQWSNGYAIHWMDVNGDGLEDFVIARPSQGIWQLRLNKGGTLGSVITTTGLGSNAGLQNYPSSIVGRNVFKYANRVPLLDVDGDGKPELTVVSTARKFAVKICTLNLVNPAIGADTPCPGLNDPVATEGGTKCALYACPQDPDTGDLNMPGMGTFRLWNNHTVYGAYGDQTGPNNFQVPDSAASDASAYHLAAIKFVQTTASTFEARLQETELVSSLTQGVQVPTSSDLFGDGLNDLFGPIGCQRDAINAGHPGCQVINDGTHGPAVLTVYPNPNATTTVDIATSTFEPSSQFLLNENVGSNGPHSLASLAELSLNNPSSSGGRTADVHVGMPEMLQSVVDGVGDSTSWAFTTLSNPGSTTDDVTGTSLPVYSFPAIGGYTDTRHYYFTSTMPVVVGMLGVNGAGGVSGFRSAAYGYSEAMYNHLGRGFQGFHKITTWVLDEARTRQTQTIATYNQKFPLTGKLDSLDTVIPPAGQTVGQTIQHETYSWICGLATRQLCPQGDTLPASPSGTGGTVYAPVLDSKHADARDLSTGVIVSHTDTINAAAAASPSSGWDTYGNLKNQIVTSADDGGFISSHTVSTTNLYPADGTFTNCLTDTANWRIADLCKSTVTTSIAYSSSHALPPVATAPSRTAVTTYQWNVDRTPKSQTVQPDDPTQAQTLTTTWTYPAPSYGLPISVAVSGPTLSPSPRTTQFTYTKNGTAAAADGYFVLTTTNPALQATTTEHSTRDGQVTKTVDPNNLKMIANYDVFGRMTGAQYQDTAGGTLLPSESISYTRCSAPDNNSPSTCPAGYSEDGNQMWAAWRVTRVQAGSPTTVDWYDVLGRNIKHSRRGFDGTFVQSVSDFDDMNTVFQQSTPFLFGQVPSCTDADLRCTQTTYDRMSRPALKKSPGAELDPLHGNVRTTYTYSGNTTTIKVRSTGVPATCSSATNLCMDMSRTYDVLGRLEQTTQGNGSTANYAVTNYWYDGAGNAVALKDAENNVITASYDDLGRRTQVVDPDAGTKTFTYDALGELLTQTDARGVQTGHVYDVLGRLTQRTATDATALAPLPKVIRDTWTFDPPGTAGGAGLLGAAQRQSGASVGALSTIWQESNTYETATKRLSSQLSQPDNQPQTWTTGHTYDANGREQTTTYPNGVVVKRGYTTYGELNQLSDNNPTPTVWWSATSKDAWGNITGETYPNGVVGVHQSYASTGQLKQQQWTNGISVLEKLAYGYDSFGNVTTQSVTQGTSTTSEAYTYDGLQRLTQASRSGFPTALPPVTYAYTPNGNLSYKSDVSIASAGGYNYGANGCGPHGVSQVTVAVGVLTTYQCDANGNIVGGSTLAGRYDFENRPWYVQRGGVSTATYGYDSAGNRYKESTVNGATTLNVSYGPSGYEQEGAWHAGRSRIELGPVTVMQQYQPVATFSAEGNLRDRLGSTVALAFNGTLKSTREYDAFGAVRAGNQGDSKAVLDLWPDTLRGFTGHEHVDAVKLIHMNGRMYDPALGRFLSVDPVIQFPTNGQSLNPYSYILNNPLSGRDPSGYCSTGSNIHQAQGPTCKSLGVGGGVEEVDPMKALASKGINAVANTWNRHVEAQTVKGEASKPLSGNPVDIGASGKTNGTTNLRVTLLDGMVIHPDEALQRELNFDEWRRRDANNFVFASAAAGWGFITGTNPWHENAPGDDSIQSATFPLPAAAGLKAAFGLAALRNASRVEQGYEVVSDISPTALKFLSSGRETQAYLGYRDGQAVYCGISCNVAARQVQHADRFDIRAMSPTMPRGQARAIEQAMILRNPQFENKINSISPTHAYYNDAVRWGESWLKANGY